MSTAIDRFGRVVIPKHLRRRFGLEPGSEVEIQASPEGVLLRVRPPSDLVVERHGVAVFTGQALGKLDDALAALRDERMTGLAPDLGAEADDS